MRKVIHIINQLSLNKFYNILVNGTITNAITENEQHITLQNSAGNKVQVSLDSRKTTITNLAAKGSYRVSVPNEYTNLIANALLKPMGVFNYTPRNACGRVLNALGIKQIKNATVIPYSATPEGVVFKNSAGVLVHHAGKYTDVLNRYAKLLRHSAEHNIFNDAEELLPSPTLQADALADDRSVEDDFMKLSATEQTALLEKHLDVAALLPFADRDFEESGAADVVDYPDAALIETVITTDDLSRVREMESAEANMQVLDIANKRQNKAVAVLGALQAHLIMNAIVSPTRAKQIERLISNMTKSPLKKTTITNNYKTMSPASLRLILNEDDVEIIEDMDGEVTTESESKTVVETFEVESDKLLEGVEAFLQGLGFSTEDVKTHLDETDVQADAAEFFDTATGEPVEVEELLEDEESVENGLKLFYIKNAIRNKPRAQAVFNRLMALRNNEDTIVEAVVQVEGTAARLDVATPEAVTSIDLTELDEKDIAKLHALIPGSASQGDNFVATFEAQTAPADLLDLPEVVDFFEAKQSAISDEVADVAKEALLENTLVVQTVSNEGSTAITNMYDRRFTARQASHTLAPEAYSVVLNHRSDAEGTAIYNNIKEPLPPVKSLQNRVRALLNSARYEKGQIIFGASKLVHNGTKVVVEGDTIYNGMHLDRLAQILNFETPFEIVPMSVDGVPSTELPWDYTEPTVTVAPVVQLDAKTAAHLTEFAESIVDAATKAVAVGEELGDNTPLTNSLHVRKGSSVASIQRAIQLQNSVGKPFDRLDKNVVSEVLKGDFSDPRVAVFLLNSTNYDFYVQALEGGIDKDVAELMVATDTTLTDEEVSGIIDTAESAGYDAFAEGVQKPVAELDEAVYGENIPAVVVENGKAHRVVFRNIENMQTFAKGMSAVRGPVVSMFVGNGRRLFVENTAIRNSVDFTEKTEGRWDVLGNDSKVVGHIRHAKEEGTYYVTVGSNRSKSNSLKDAKQVAKGYVQQIQNLAPVGTALRMVEDIGYADWSELPALIQAFVQKFPQYRADAKALLDVVEAQRTTARADLWDITYNNLMGKFTQSVQNSGWVVLRDVVDADGYMSDAAYLGVTGDWVDYPAAEVFTDYADAESTANALGGVVVENRKALKNNRRPIHNNDDTASVYLRVFLDSDDERVITEYYEVRHNGETPDANFWDAVRRGTDKVGALIERGLGAIPGVKFHGWGDDGNTGEIGLWSVPADPQQYSAAVAYIQSFGHDLDTKETGESVEYTRYEFDGSAILKGVEFTDDEAYGIPNNILFVLDNIDNIVVNSRQIHNDSDADQEWSLRGTTIAGEDADGDAEDGEPYADWTIAEVDAANLSALKRLTPTGVTYTARNGGVTIDGMGQEALRAVLAKLDPYDATKQSTTAVHFIGGEMYDTLYGVYTLDVPEASWLTAIKSLITNRKGQPMTREMLLNRARQNFKKNLANRKALKNNRPGLK